MKQMLLIITCIAMLNLSCKKQDEDGSNYPTAKFKIYDEGHEGPRLIEFENISENASYYLWDFGQGGMLEPQGKDMIKTRAYSKGTYTVVLKAYGYGYVSIYSQQIVVKDK